MELLKNNGTIVMYILLHSKWRYTTSIVLDLNRGELAETKRCVSNHR